MSCDEEDLDLRAFLAFTLFRSVEGDREKLRDLDCILELCLSLSCVSGLSLESDEILLLFSESLYPFDLRELFSLPRD